LLQHSFVGDFGGKIVSSFSLDDEEGNLSARQEGEDRDDDDDGDIFLGLGPFGRVDDKNDMFCRLDFSLRTIAVASMLMGVSSRDQPDNFDDFL